MPGEICRGCPPDDASARRNVGGDQSLVDAEVEAEQILGHDGEPQDDEGKADDPREADVAP